MPGYDSAKTGYVRAAGLTDRIYGEVAETRRATGLSLNAIVSFLVRRSDFAALAAKGRGRMKSAKSRGTAGKSIGCAVPRELADAVESAAKNLGLPRGEVVSAALYSIRGNIGTEIFAKPA